MKLVWEREKVHSSTGLAGKYTRQIKLAGYLHPYRVPTGKVVFEIGGGIREEIARDGQPLSTNLVRIT